MINDSNKLKSFIKQLSSISQQYGKRAVIENINNAIDKIDNSTSILFCGEFKRGKSSLINAIIGDEICPTDIGIATAVVTRIMYGQTKKAVRYYGNLLEGENALKKEEIAWDDIQKYTVGDVIEIGSTVQMDLYYPSEFLKEGLVVIDTPGIGGLDPRHANLTAMALPYADIAVFITDASEPVTESELKFYEKKVASRVKSTIVLINKSDILSQDVLQTHIETTRNTFLSVGNPTIVAVSAMNWLLYNQLEDEEFKVSSNRDAVIAAINSQIKMFRKGQLMQFRDILLSEINDILETVKVEKMQLEANHNTQNNAIQNYKDQQQKLAQFRNEIANPTSSIRLQVNSLFENARNEVLNQISHEGTLLTTSTFDRLIDSEKGLNNDGKWLVAQINDELQELSYNVNLTTKKTFDQISKTFEKKISEVLSDEDINISDELRIHSVLNSQLAFNLAGKFAQGGIIATALAIGADFLIPGIGWAVGLMSAAALIWRRLNQENQQQKKMMIRQQVLPKINLAITDLRNQINTQFTKYHQNILQTIQTMLSETEEKMKAIQQTIIESRENEKKFKENMSIIEQREKFLNTLYSQMKLLYSNPFGHAEQ
mgnify:FL=1